jgi:uncharacterized lipoprotein YmbA
MSQAMKRIARLVLVVMALCGLDACSTTAPARFYTLSSLRQLANASAGATTSDREAGLSTLLVGTIEIPQTLDRPQLVRHSGINKIDVAEYDRWAEPLDAMTRRVLAEDLTTLLPDSRVVASRQPAMPIDQTLVVEVARFDADNAGRVIFEAQWFVFAGRNPVPRLSRRATIEEPAASGESEAVVAAMSKALARFAREIAAALAAFPPAPLRPSRPG